MTSSMPGRGQRTQLGQPASVLRCKQFRGQVGSVSWRYSRRCDTPACLDMALAHWAPGSWAPRSLSFLLLLLLLLLLACVVFAVAAAGAAVGCDCDSRHSTE